MPDPAQSSRMSTAPNFQKYSAFYDLLYRDKNYSAEADYIARTIRNHMPHARTVLELGSGTGRHGRLLAELGFQVHGIERSSEMVSIAQAADFHRLLASGGSFTCELGDICMADVGGTFDAIVALFHVISYQTSNPALQAAFNVAASHLLPGGLFVFDVWHGPAVVFQRPSERVKEVQDGELRVRRTAHPKVDDERNTVNVVYDMDCKDTRSGETIRFSEEHLMRYLFPTEVDLLAGQRGFRCLRSEEFLTGQPASRRTWGVVYVLQR